MPTPGAEERPGAGTAVKEVAGRAGTAVKAALELARREVKSKASAIGLGVGAVLVALFALGFLIATIAIALAIVLDAWLALLIVTLALFATAGILGLSARAKLTGGGTPAERQELETAVAQLRDGVSEATDVTGSLRTKLPVIAAGALGAGFFLAGGIGASMRFLARKGRER